MSKLEQERRRLSQEHHLDYFRKEFNPLEMMPVYFHTSGKLVFASLVPTETKRTSSRAILVIALGPLTSECPAWSVSSMVLNRLSSLVNSTT